MPIKRLIAAAAVLGVALCGGAAFAQSAAPAGTVSAAHSPAAGSKVPFILIRGHGGGGGHGFGGHGGFGGRGFGGRGFGFRGGFRGRGFRGRGFGWGGYYGYGYYGCGSPYYYPYCYY
jgi:hypothetical protein